MGVEWLVAWGTGAAIYVVAAARVLNHLIREAGYKAAMMHERAVEVEKAKWPSSWEDDHSQVCIRRREELYRHGLMLKAALTPPLWPLALVWAISARLVRSVVGDYRQAWKTGYQDAERLQRAKVAIAAEEARIMAIAAELKVSENALSSE